MSNVVRNQYGYKSYMFWVGPNTHITIYKYEVWATGRRWMGVITFRETTTRWADNYPRKTLHGGTKRKVRDKIAKEIKHLRAEELRFRTTYSEGMRKKGS